MKKIFKAFSACLMIMGVCGCSPVAKTSEPIKEDDDSLTGKIVLGFTDVRIPDNQKYMTRDEINNIAFNYAPKIDTYGFLRLPLYGLEDDKLTMDPTGYSTNTYGGDVEYEITREGNPYNNQEDSYLFIDVNMDLYTKSLSQTVEVMIVYLDLDNNIIFTDNTVYCINTVSSFTKISHTVTNNFKKVINDENGDSTVIVKNYSLTFTFNCGKPLFNSMVFCEYDENDELIKKSDIDILEKRVNYEASPNCAYIIAEKTGEDGIIMRELINRSETESTVVVRSAKEEYPFYNSCKTSVTFAK